MGSFPPQNQKHWIRVLKKLGFVENKRVGIGGHAKKFYHPGKNSNNYKEQPNFIIVQKNMYKQMSQKIVKELSYWDITPDEIDDCC